MSYATAKAQLVSIVSDVLPTDNRLVGEGLRFVHVGEGHSGAKFRSRSFWLEANMAGDGGVTGPFTPTLQGQPRFTFTMTMTVAYQMYPKQRGVMDELLAADQLAYSAALLTPANWNRPTSGIHNLTGAPLYLPTKRAVVGEMVEQRSTFDLWFH